MTFSGRSSCQRRLLVMVGLVLSCVLGGAHAVSAGNQSAQPAPHRDPLVVSAISAVDAERQLLAELPPPGQPPAAQLRERIRAADDRGVAVLEQLRRAGYPISAAVETALGPLPRPGADGAASLPGPGVYQDAIEALESARPRQAPPTAVGGGAAPPASTAGRAASSSGGIDAMNLLVAAVVVLAALVVLLSVLMGRRRADTRLAEFAHSDSLTGLANRRRLDEDLHVCRRDRRSPVAVLMVDVDNFKIVNDTHGHAAGDRILQAIGTLLSREVRSRDVVYRYGGEEFCVLLPGASGDEALGVAERIRRSTAAMQVPVGGSVSVSVGVAVGAASEVMETLGLADAALFDAKRDGRNRVALARGGTDRAAAPVGVSG